MSNKMENPYNALSRIFHEPNRLAIVSALCSATNGLSFRDLKEECALTDGNLSRHLKALEEAEMVQLKKRFIGAKPRTTILLTEYGREQFIAYLQALEEVLKKAAEAVSGEEKQPDLFSYINPAKA